MISTPLSQPSPAADAHTHSICVIGGGPAGLATALAVASTGRPVAVLAPGIGRETEKQPARPVDARTTAILADGITFSPNGSVLYAVRLNANTIVGNSVPDTGPGTLVYTSPGVPATGMDGLAIGLGTLSGYAYTNANDGTVWEVGLPGGPT